MNTQTIAQILGWTATILFTVCYIPQIIKTLKSKTVAGLSFWLLGTSFIANIVALFYAILIHQYPLQIKYALGLIFLSITMGTYYHIKRKEHKG